MKRSEMIAIIKEFIVHFENKPRQPKKGLSMRILSAIEEAGMLPPDCLMKGKDIYGDQISICREQSFWTNKWEPEDDLPETP